MLQTSFYKDIYTAHEGPFSVFHIRPGDSFDTWLHQNRAEIVDVREGCLLDNYLIACNHGVAICTEEYVSSWASRYSIKFERGAGAAVYAAWDNFTAEYDSLYREEA